MTGRSVGLKCKLREKKSSIVVGSPTLCCRNLVLVNHRDEVG